MRCATRFGILEMPRLSVRRHFGGSAHGMACGLALRLGHGSRYMADTFREEFRSLETESSLAFLRASKGNGCAEHLIRTLKENLLWVRTLDMVEELRRVLLEFRDTYNAAWLLERHGYRQPKPSA